jgi:hypothetical protein
MAGSRMGRAGDGTLTKTDPSVLAPLSKLTSTITFLTFYYSLAATERKRRTISSTAF